MRPPRRRSFLRLAGLAVAGAAGCLSGDGESSPTAPTTRPPTPTDAPDTETYGPTDGPDERPTTTPPGTPALSPSGSWPQYRFDAGNTGYAPDVPGLRDGTGYWRLDAGRAPTVADGTLYNVRTREDPATFARRDPATAAVRSRTELVSYAVNSPPAVADGRAFVTTFSEVFCLATDRDEVLWRGPRTRGIQGAPTVADDALLVNCGGYAETTPRLTVFEFDGTERWTYESGVRSRATPAVGDGAVFVTTDAGVHAVELETGEERFVSDAVSHGWGSVAVADGTAYVVDYRSSDERRYRLYALDTADGSVRWAAETGRAHGPPVVADGTVYAVGPNETMLALDAEGGSARELPNRRAVPVACTEDVLYARRGGTLYAYDATTGEGLWSYATPEVQVADTVQLGVYGVTPVDGAVYVDAADGLHGVGPAE